jgi:hypothetical protein
MVAHATELVSLAPDVIITNGGRATSFSKRGFCELGYAMVAKVPRRPQDQPSAQTEVRPRRRGRPVDEGTLANDQTVIDCAMAFVHFGLGSQRARDLARALVEGRSIPGRKLPRGGRKAAPGSRVVAYEMPLPLKSLEQRVARRLKRGKIQPRPKVVAQYVMRPATEGARHAPRGFLTGSRPRPCRRGQ